MLKGFALHLNQTDVSFTMLKLQFLPLILAWSIKASPAHIFVPSQVPSLFLSSDLVFLLDLGSAASLKMSLVTLNCGWPWLSSLDLLFFPFVCCWKSTMFYLASSALICLLFLIFAATWQPIYGQKISIWGGFSYPSEKNKTLL